MLFSKSSMTPELLKKDFPEVFESIYQSGITAGQSATAELEAGYKTQIEALNATISGFTAEKEEADRVAKIHEYAKKVGGSDEAVQHCINEKLDFSASLAYLVDNKATESATRQEAVASSAAALFNPPLASQSSSSDNDDTAPDNFVTAMKMIAKRDGCTFEEARKKAAHEFPGLFAKQTNLSLDSSDDSLNPNEGSQSSGEGSE